jgi:hypothetical protein
VLRFAADSLSGNKKSDNRDLDQGMSFAPLRSLIGGITHTYVAINYPIAKCEAEYSFQAL